jgi:hypothetical protein
MPSWKVKNRVVVVVRCNSQLAEMIEALSPPGGFAGGLNRRKEQCHQDADDCDHHQQLNERKSATALHVFLASQK